MASKYIGARELMKQNGYLVADILDLITSGKLAAYYHDGRKIANIHFQKEYEYRGDFISEYMLGNEIFKTSINGGNVLKWLWENRGDVYAFPFLDKDALRLGLSVHERQRIAKDTKFLAKDLDNLMPTNNTSISPQQAEAGSADEEAVHPKRRRSYNTLIAFLLKKAYPTLNPEDREATGKVELEMRLNGYSLDEKVVRKIIREAGRIKPAKP